jgi:Tfp pilus assembly protein PilN
MLRRATRAGLFVDDGALGFAALGSGGLTWFRHQVEDAPGAGLKGELEGRELRLRKVRVGLRRGRVLVKILELPAASARGAIDEMVGFELERHVPFAPEDMAWSWMPIPSPKGGMVRGLVVACERRAVEQALRILEESRLRPLSVTVACHDLPALLARGRRPGRAVWAHRAGSSTDLLLLAEGRVLLSRTVSASDPGTLAAEVGATAALLRWPDWNALWISGDGAGSLLEAPEVAAATGVPSSPPPWAPAVASVLPSLPTEDTGAGILSLAVALGSRRPRLDLLPAEQRPRRLSAGQVLTAATTGLALLLAVGLFWADARRDQRYLARLNRALRVLEPEVRAVEQIRAETAQKKRLLAAIQAAEQNSLRPLPFLRELTEAIPQDAWVTALSVDGKGIEITGQAAAANQLIPLLEGSGWLDRVEFTSPVTRGRDKEQFRLRAAWELGPRGPASPALSAAAPAPAGTGPRSAPAGPIARPGSAPAVATPTAASPPAPDGTTRAGRSSPAPAPNAPVPTAPASRDGETRPTAPAASAPPPAPPPAPAAPPAASPAPAPPEAAPAPAAPPDAAPPASPIPRWGRERLGVPR